MAVNRSAMEARAGVEPTYSDLQSCPRAKRRGSSQAKP